MTLSTLPQSLLTDPQTTELSDRLDAARALLGVSPPSSSSSSSASLIKSSSTANRGVGQHVGARNVLPLPIPKQHIHFGGGKAIRSISDVDTAETASLSTSFGSSSASDTSFMMMLGRSRRRSRSGSAGLDALAFLATKEQATINASQSTTIIKQTRFVDDIIIPGVPSFVTSSSRSASSSPLPPPATATTMTPPSSFSHQQQQLRSQMPPPAIPISGASTPSTSTPDSSDSEVATNTAERTKGYRRRSMSNPEGLQRWKPRRNRVQFILPEPILEKELAEANSAVEAMAEKERRKALEEEESQLTHEQLLRRARSRLLEDLSEGSISGDKGAVALPHSLAKYKNVYNKNGRIGIYTPAERAAIIARFHDKRTRRVWNKRIRYNCRKNLADRRLRVKGRFVKRSTEQKVANTKPAKPAATSKTAAVAIVGQPANVDSMDQDADPVTEAGAPIDLDNIDPNDPNSPFSPTDDLPYRRLRRHTIT